MIRDQETHNILLNNISRFVGECLVPDEELVAETNETTVDVVADMKAMGLFGLKVPESFGGLELTMEEEVLAMLELGRASQVFSLPAWDHPRHRVAGHPVRRHRGAEGKVRDAQHCKVPTDLKHMNLMDGP